MRLQPPAEEAEEIERGVVGPVDVFDDGDSRRQAPAQLTEERAEEPVAGGICRQQAVERAACLHGDVLQRAEGTGRRERVTDAAQHPPAAVRGGLLAETGDERGLADAGLAADAHEPALTGRGLAQPAVERVEVLVPLQQVHMARVGGRRVLSIGLTDNQT